MYPYQFETARLYVVEFRSRPGYFGMAGLAVGWKSQRRMGRRLDSVVIIFVTSETQLRRPRKCHGMAAGAVDSSVRPPQRERRSMLVHRLAPARRYRGMAFLAIPTEIGKRMIGIGCAVEIVYMASLALHRRLRKLLAPLRYMTGIAIGEDVHSHQRESPLGVGLQNILPILPVDGSVAIPAIYPELRAMYIRMAIDAFDSNIGEFKVHMTFPALGILMRPGQRKSGFRMREIRRLLQYPPSFSGMAGVTIPFNPAMGVSFRRYIRRQNGDK